MSKRAKATCSDCYFRRAGLCALPGETTCPTFRLHTAGRMARRSSRASCRARSPRTQPRRLCACVSGAAPPSTPASSRRTGSRSSTRRLIALLLLVAYAIAFVLENRKSVHLHFVFATASVSLVWLILLSLAVGFVVGILLSQLERRRRRRRAASSAASRAIPVGDLVRRDEAEREPQRLRAAAARRRSRCPSRT